MRTHDEIVLRIQETTNEDDPRGLYREALICALPFGTAMDIQPSLKESVTDVLWETLSYQTEPKIREALASNLSDAWRSANVQAITDVVRFSMWARGAMWLLGLDGDYLTNDPADLEFYGKDRLRRLSEQLGLDWQAHDDGRWVDMTSVAGESLTPEAAWSELHG